MEVFDQENRGHPNYNGAANDTIHVEALQAEHLLDTKPGHYLRSDQYNAEKNTGDEEFDVFHSCNKNGKMNQVVTNPPSIKQQVATKEGHCSEDMPIMECPEVHPPA